MIVHPGTLDHLRQEDHKFELSLVSHNETPSQKKKRQKLGQIKGNPIDGIDGFHHQCISLLLTLGNLRGKNKRKLNNRNFEKLLTNNRKLSPLCWYAL